MEKRWLLQLPIDHQLLVKWIVLWNLIILHNVKIRKDRWIPDSNPKKPTHQGTQTKYLKLYLSTCKHWLQQLHAIALYSQQQKPNAGRWNECHYQWNLRE